jgi:threonine synthase
MGFQAYNSAPLVLGHPVSNPETVATAIRIGNPASKDKALDAIKESDGNIDRIKDEDILKAQFLLSTSEGIFAEPASCISLAGLIKAKEEGRVNQGSKVVCVLTGNGLKDSDIILDNPYEYATLKSDYKVIEDYILRGNK